MNERIPYLDTLKGVAILWVVLYHLSVVPLGYFLPLFFFVSGLFFRADSLGNFAKRSLNRLVVPLVFFCLVSLLLPVLRDWIVEPWANFRPLNERSSCGDAFVAMGSLCRTHIADIPFLYNGALWFVLVLLWVEWGFFALSKALQTLWGKVVGVVLIYTVCEVLMRRYGVNGPMFFPLAGSYLLSYAAGALFGRRLIEAIRPMGRAVWWFLGAILCWIGLEAVGGQWSDVPRMAAFVVVAVSGCRLLPEGKFLEPLRFFGRNSFVVLVTHIPVFIVFDYTLFKMMGLNEGSHTVLFNAIKFVLACGTSSILVVVFNKYLPWAVGKKALFFRDKKEAKA